MALKMIIYFSVCLIIIMATRFLAYWGIQFLNGNDITIIPNWIYLSYVENRGAAFGIFQDAKIFLVTVTIILFVCVTYYVVSKKNLQNSILIPLAMIAGGGVSNLADRLTFGFVVDYIDFRIIHFAVFNLADSCVVLGTLFLAYKILTTKEEVKDESR